MSLSEARGVVMRNYSDSALNLRKLTVGDAAMMWGEMYASRHRKTYKEDLRRIKKWIIPYLGKTLITELKRPHVVELHNRISRAGAVEANRCVTLLRAIFNKLSEWDYYSGPNPATRIKKNLETPRDRVARDEELERLLETLSKHEYGDLFFLTLNCGLRPSEAMGSRWENLRSNKSLLIKHRKNKKDHIVTLPGWLFYRLWTRKQSKGYIFVSKKTKTRFFDIRKQWDKVRRDADLPDLQFRDLRRTFATLAIEVGGASIEEVKEALGHSSVIVTERYVHLKSTAAGRAFESFQKKMNKKD